MVVTDPCDLVPCLGVPGLIDQSQPSHPGGVLICDCLAACPWATFPGAVLVVTYVAWGSV